MELRRIHYFIAVAEECHFGRAAARLQMAQPPLSQQIKHLEAEMGVTLFTRSTRKVELTPAGERFLDRARQIVLSVDEAVDEAVRVADGMVGTLAIGFTGSATYDLLPSLARVLRAELPGIELDLKGEMLTPDQVSALLDGTLDLAFLRPPVRSADIDVRVLRREPLIAVLPEAHPLAGRAKVKLADLRDEPFITYPSHHRSVVYESVIDACQRSGFAPSLVHEVGETSTLVSFVAAGLGVALVPASVQHLKITGAHYLPLAGNTEEVELALATRVDDRSPHVARVRARAETLIGGARRVRNRSR
ncbi:LysR family transcriptional regulator [uncultured Jatrophihabitans sp.]|uniref:LysR family transcriptional regulator n=1 Tax=uncultured Jatrophihabitans sp. TaxID=1610747 RepID=UPI0035CBDDE4